MYALQKRTDFSKKSTHIARRALNVLRLALLWARKGGVFRNKHRLAISLSEFSKLTRKIFRSQRESRGALAYGDHEFSFDETPVFHVKMRRRTFSSSSSSLRYKLSPHFPCIKPRVDLDLDYGDDDDDFVCYYRDEDEILDRRDDDGDYDDGDEEDYESETNGDCDEGIDLKAEEFIANFYEQMKLQRQISYLGYSEARKSGAN